MHFENALEAVLPADLPLRDRVVNQCAIHLALIQEANRQFNLTRITSPMEAAIKHVLDSVLPWRHFAGEGHVLDAGTGAGFPGIPLALVLPGVRFTLAESVGKKARFVTAAVNTLLLANVEVVNARAEEALRKMPPGVLTGRAIAPLNKACALFGPPIRAGWRALLYKGPDAQAEMDAAGPEIARHRLRVQVIDSYVLPEGMGTRMLVEMKIRNAG